MTARLPLLALTAALLAAALPVTAAGSLVANAVEYDAPATQTGDLAMLFVSDRVLDDTGQSAAGARPWVDLSAASISAVEYEERYAEGGAPGTEFKATGPPTDPKTTPSEFTQAQARLSEFQPGFRLNVYRLDGTIAYSVDSVGGRFASIQTAIMGPGGFGRDAVLAGSPASEEPRDFGIVERPGPWVEHYLTKPKMSVVLQGDFVVEMSGLSLEVDAESGPGMLRSGFWRSPVDPNAPPESTLVASSVTERFVRMHLQGAVLEFATEDGQPELVWAATDVAADFSGESVLLDASGQVPDAQLDHDRHVLPAGTRIVFQALAGDELELEIAPSSLGTRGGTLASVPAPASAALIGTGAVLALAIAIGLGVLRKLLRLPALADVEKAIEEGEYRKAARLAGRILSRLPGSEEALLGRAIALSKSGRHQDVVAELTSHLALRPASDGTLHYVLGLAQLDSGKAADAQASLREAVRLTPSLQAEVAPRLGKAFSVAQPTTKETAHGYA
jgi:hypothetical protein